MFDLNTNITKIPGPKFHAFVGIYVVISVAAAEQDLKGASLPSKLGKEREEKLLSENDNI